MQHSHLHSARGLTTVAELNTELAEELQNTSPQGHSVLFKGIKYVCMEEEQKESKYMHLSHLMAVMKLQFQHLN